MPSGAPSFEYVFDNDSATRPHQSHEDISVSRLAHLAARVSAAPMADAPPQHGHTPPAGAVARLVDRWIPAGLVARARALASARRRWLVAAVAATVVMVGALVVLAQSRPAVEKAPALPAATHAAAQSPDQPAPAEQHEEPEAVVVSVVGKVSTPGLVTVPDGARVADAVQEAGGAVSEVDLATVNLARRLVDGEQLYIGIPVPPGAQQGQQPQDAGATGESSGQIELNSASAEQLESLSGVGEVTAERILEWRTQHGGFDTVEQLREVDGIGEKRFERLRDSVTVG